MLIGGQSRLVLFMQKMNLIKPKNLRSKTKVGLILLYPKLNQYRSQQQTSDHQKRSPSSWKLLIQR